MAIAIKARKLGMGTAPITLVEWNFREGDWIQKGALVVVVETEKIRDDIEAEAPGFLHITAPGKCRLLPGRVIGLIAETREELALLRREAPLTVSARDESEPAGQPVAVSPESVSSRQKRTLISPAARRLAEEHMIDIAGLRGTGPSGRIVRKDIQRVVGVEAELEFEEKLMKESREKLRCIFDCAPDGITVTDLDGIVTEVNDRVVELHGYMSRHEMLGRSAYSFIAPHCHERVRRNMQRVFKYGHIGATEYSFMKADGSEILVELISSLLRDGQDRPIGFVGVTRDITQRKLAEEALRTSEEFARNLLSCSPIPIIVFNPDSSIRYVNPALEILTGYSADELVNLRAPYPWHIVQQHGPEVGSFGPADGEQEMIFSRNNGDLLRVQVKSVDVLKDGSIQYRLSHWVDITMQKRLEENMQFYVKEITRAQEEERKRIARELHDDTAQTLTTMCFDIDQIASSHKDLSSGVAEELRRLRFKADAILEGIRRFSQELRPALLDRVGLVPSVELLLEDVGKGRLLTPTIEVRGAERRLSPETESGLFRIAQEAIHNASRHSQATQVKVVFEFSPKKVRLEVSDNGSGFVVPEVLGDLVRDKRFGLVGISERVRILNGSLALHSELGEGTSLSVEVPV